MKIKYEGHVSNGVISILILNNHGGISEYEYKVDTARIPAWRKRILYEPHQHGAILKEIKRNATWYRRVGY